MSFVSRLLPRSQFVRQVFTLATGTAIGQVIAIASAPITSRIYTPDDYGALGAYLSISGIATTAATLVYHQPIVLTESDVDARDLVGTCLLSSLATALLVGVIVILLGPVIANHLGVPSLRAWLLAVPASTICAGMGTALSYWINRRGAYQALASSRVVTAFVPVPITIAIGLLWPGPMGLLIGLLLVHVMMAATAALAAHRLGFRFNEIDLVNSRALARQYRAYPFFTLPTDLVTTFATTLPVHLLIAFAGASAVGAFSMSTRLLGLPALMIGTAIGEVFRREAAAQSAVSGSCRPLLRATLRSAGAIAVPVFLLIVVAGPDLFAFALGEKWRDAGHASQVLAPMFCLRFIVSPISVVYYLRNRLREDFLLHLLLLILIGSGMSVASSMDSGTTGLLTAYALAYGAIYVVYLVRSYQLSGEQPSRPPPEVDANGQCLR